MRWRDEDPDGLPAERRGNPPFDATKAGIARDSGRVAGLPAVMDFPAELLTPSWGRLAIAACGVSWK
jgi:hypothetical protein